MASPYTAQALVSQSFDLLVSCTTIGQSAQNEVLNYSRLFVCLFSLFELVAVVAAAIVE